MLLPQGQQSKAPHVRARPPDTYKCGHNRCHRLQRLNHLTSRKKPHNPPRSSTRHVGWNPRSVNCRHVAIVERASLGDSSPSASPRHRLHQCMLQIHSIVCVLADDTSICILCWIQFGLCQHELILAAWQRPAQVHSKVPVMSACESLFDPSLICAD